MKITSKFFAAIALTVTISLSSCSSNDNDNELIEQDLSEIVMQDFVENINTIAVPSGLSSSNDTYAQQANLQFQTIKSLSASFTALFTIPPNAIAAKFSDSKSNKGAVVLNSKTYTWSAEGVTVNYTITDTSDRYSFAYNIISDEFTGKFMDGYQLKNGSYAEANLYAGGNESMTIKWWLDNDISKVELAFDDGKITLESNLTNNAGKLEVYESATLIGLFEWNADGSGKFTDFENNETFTW